MNEWYSADPKSFATSREMEFFLRQFGPETGRYLMSLPADWRQSVVKGFPPESLERKRAVDAIGRALQRGVLFSSASVPEAQDHKSWIALAKDYFLSKPTLIEAYIARTSELSTTALPDSMPAVSYDDFHLAPSAQETIKAQPAEFARISERLVNMAHEIVLVDPYLDLNRDDNYSVVSEMLSKRAASRPTTVDFWVRASEVSPRKEIEERARELQGLKDGKGELSIVVRAVDDARAADRLHARYLLTSRGAIMVDQGFQRLNRGRTTPVSPVVSTALSDLQTKFIARQNDLKVIWSIAL